MKKLDDLDLEKIFELLLSLAPHARASHHEHGKIILQLSMSGLGQIQNLNVQDIANVIPGILATRKKLLSRSLEIRYDEKELPYDLWESLLELQDTPEHIPLVRARLKRLLEAAITQPG